MSEQGVYMSVNKLGDFMIDALIAMGAPDDNARIIAELITSDLWCILSHCVANLKMYHERMKAGLKLQVTKLTLIKDNQAAAV
jgi:LDH2 family malate/lactate/ureidoglycolate dehydrogenase